MSRSGRPDTAKVRTVSALEEAITCGFVADPHRVARVGYLGSYAFGPKKTWHRNVRCCFLQQDVEQRTEFIYGS